ncbi:MAG: hypothetical protein V1909_05885 [Candidatus Micrarchaeota archaeon]
MRSLRGQSATEQIITYGWAGMILIVVLGVLLYFGVFNFSNSIPERCVFQNGFFCKSHRLYAESNGNITASVYVTNKLSQKVKITSILCSEEPVNPATGYPARGLFATSLVMLPEGTKNFTISCFKKDGTYKASPGESYQGLIYVKYVIEYGQSVPTPTVSSGEHIKIANIGGKIN